MTGSKPTALVVDDSRTIRTVMKVALTKAGFEVVAQAETGTQALAMYEQHKPTLITLDIVIPELDGVSVALSILQRYPGAKVVMCSSLTAQDKIATCQEAGVTDFIIKPFTLDRVLTTAQAILKTLPPTLAISA
jgi:two-component system chemotaxis response regulator CheY